MRYPLNDVYNLKQKFDGQMQSAVNLGYNVYHFAYDKKNVYLVNINENTKKKIISTSFGFLKIYRNTFGFYDLYKALKKAIKGIKFDSIYMRSKIVGYTAVNTFKRYKEQGGKLIVEIPSYNSKEQILSFFRIVVQKLLSFWQKKLPQYVDLYTVIGADDLKEYKGRPAICISNGVCVENFPIHRHKANGELHILALASMRKWHGYDRLIRGLAGYKGEKTVHIEMVGSDGDGSLYNWQKLAEDLGVSQFVHFRGGLYSEALTDIINCCDIAVATLGLHRNNNTTGSVLKAREYCARGIPFVYAYEDSGLKGDEQFVLKIEGNDNPVDMEKLVAWANELEDKETVAEEMRAFAQENMSWEAQLSRSFNFVFG